ncbi:MAG TPA: 16S rRNA (cytosine(1402)-N(4))-methyltransferase RsmH [Gammaproteobacteria bacterium]
MEHQPVMLRPVLEALDVQADGIYIDGTFGRGGHAAAILERLGPAGRLFALDRDPEAVAEGRRRFGDDPRFAIFHESFEMLKHVGERCGIEGRVNGILLDLGVSSPQLDDPGRGFSFQHDGPLDMRMDNSRGVSAAEWLAHAGEAEIADVLWRYGEERHARRIARQIVAQRETEPITTTGRLAELIRTASPPTERHKNPATRSFQAIRIFINRELEALPAALRQSVELLARGGRLAVISFHSLEDRIVKRFMREQAAGKALPRGLPVRDGHVGRNMHLIGKAMKPSAAEADANPRARSAVLRVAEKL